MWTLRPPLVFYSKNSLSNSSWLFLPIFRNILHHRKEQEVAMPDVLWSSVSVQNCTIIRKTSPIRLCGWPPLLPHERQYLLKTSNIVRMWIGGLRFPRGPSKSSMSTFQNFDLLAACAGVGVWVFELKRLTTTKYERRVPVSRSSLPFPHRLVQQVLKRFRRLLDLLIAPPSTFRSGYWNSAIAFAWSLSKAPNKRQMVAASSCFLTFRSHDDVASYKIRRRNRAWVQSLRLACVKHENMFDMRPMELSGRTKQNYSKCIIRHETYQKHWHQHICRRDVGNCISCSRCKAYATRSAFCC